MSDFPPVPPGALPGGAPPAAYPTGPPLAPPLPPVPPGSVRPGSPWSDHSPLPPAPPSGPRPGVVIAAVLAVLALVAATVAAFAGDGDGDDVSSDREPREREAPTTTEGATPTTEGTTPGRAPAPEDFDAVIDEIEAFVEQERGLPFLREVTVELADDAEFEDRLLADFEEDVAEIETTGRVLEAIGLIDAGTDVVAAVRRLLGVGVVGFYDPATDELVVRGTSTSPYVRTVIAHELTHALDDQHFELERPDVDGADDERGFGFTGLVEGNARRVEDAYRATFTDEEEQAAVDEENALALPDDLIDIPWVLIENLIAPYELGPVLVDALLDDGGQARLDAAFVEPPTTSEHLLDPSSFLDGEVAADVPLPTTDDGAPAIDQGVLGALGLAEVLGLSPVLFPGPLDDAVEGWGGDRYVAWADLDGSGTCLRATITGDTPEDTGEIRVALDDWAASAPFGIAATVGEANGGVGPVFMTSCSA